MKILIALLCIGMTLAQQPVTYDCSAGCTYCRGKYGCLLCSGSQRVPKTSSNSLEALFQKPADQFGCAPLDPNDNCVEYIGWERASICGKCKPGYALYESRAECVKIEIPNCKAALIRAEKLYCIVCENQTRPNKDFTACDAYTSQTGKFAHCLAVSYSEESSEDVACVLCKEGYTAFNGFCISTPEEFEGCAILSAKGDFCYKCNYSQGWYARTKDSFKCSRGTL